MRGIVSVVFDDGYTAVYNEVVPLLNRRQLPAVFAIPIDGSSLEHETGEPLTPAVQWLSVTQRGHEIAAHSVTHTDFTELSNADLQIELFRPQQELNATTLVYPGGAHNDRVVELAAKYYSAARTVNKGIERLRPRDPLHLSTYNWSRANWSLAKANALVLWAYLTNRWLIETYHLVSTKAPDNIEHWVPLAEFERHIDFIQRVPIETATIKTVIEKRN